MGTQKQLRFLRLRSPALRLTLAVLLPLIAVRGFLVTNRAQSSVNQVGLLLLSLATIVKSR